MMKSMEIDIANAVVEELNGGPFSQSFIAERAYTPYFDLQDMKALKVTVMPRGLTINSVSRDRNQNDFSIDVAIQKKLTKGDTAEVDPLAKLVEEIRDHFQLLRLGAFPTAMWSTTDNNPLYDPEHFLNLRQFTSVVTFTFRVLRS